MSCSHCNNKGYQESSIIRDNNNFPMIVKCPNPNCPYIKDYYNEIKKRFSEKPTLDKGELVVPPKEFKQEFLGDFNKPTPQSIEVNIPQSVIDQGQDSVSSYIADKIRNHTPYPGKLDNPQNTPDPTGQPGPTGPNQVPSNGPARKVEMDTEYPNLPKPVVDKFKELVKNAGEPLALVLDTPFGPKQMKNLEEANRVLGVINKYYDHGADLDHADKQENVTVFPLGRSLGME